MEKAQQKLDFFDSLTGAKKRRCFFAFNNSQTEFKHRINNLGYRL